jgi:GNAT superfamily N-acetyltransferase
MPNANPPLVSARIRSILEADRYWAAYALADLQPTFAPYCQWSIGESSHGDGVVLLFTALNPPIVFTMGAVAGVRAALFSLPLPETIYITARLEHYPLLAELFSFGDTAHQMQRMICSTPSQVENALDPRLTRLREADSTRLQQLYSLGGEYAPTYFDPYQLQDGVYFGATDESGALVAAGGTHILERSESIAAIGNMYTREGLRGHGLGSAILRAIIATLHVEGFRYIFLNVDLRNSGAQRLYRRYGFADYCRFMEGKGIRRA